MAIRSCSIENKIEQTQSNHIILSFERRHLASSRLNLEFEDYIQANLDVNFVGILLSYSLMMALLIQSGFPSCETIYIETHPEMDICKVLPIQHNFVLLCHTSLNQHKPHQPPLDLLFERTLRTDPLAFFLPFVDPQIDIAHSLLNTSLCGFHALCRRGVHLDLMDTEYVQTGKHVINSYWQFISPFISDTFLLFLHFPPPTHPLLLFTAPFGDCRSLKELFRSVRHGNNVDHDNSTELRVTTRCQNLEWLNIPTGFGSALVHSITREHPLSDTSRLVSYDISFVGNAIFNKFGDELNPFCYRAMFSTIPAEVSVLLEFVKRMVSVGSVEFAMAMVRFGLLDIVIRAVSESSFLEDYENGICVIGILLRSIRDFGKKQEMVECDFSRLLTGTSLE
ncbi:hypothetical protein BLNAU_23895 [Blattamonas nauphoetae]|uniref:Uncharacterized protein n=1 Tax=Blattamonas nauphoetae TaxID=2049346 RepID=A0ABQ9WNW9_9EUKA|nr:hypothetical protein BLNAU_23895 [Blattamonas nauphoetae]